MCMPPYASGSASFSSAPGCHYPAPQGNAAYTYPETERPPLGSQLSCELANTARDAEHTFTVFDRRNYVSMIGRSFTPSRTHRPQTSGLDESVLYALPSSLCRRRRFALLHRRLQPLSEPGNQHRFPGSRPPVANCGKTDPHERSRHAIALSTMRASRSRRVIRPSKPLLAHSFFMSRISFAMAFRS